MVSMLLCACQSSAETMQWEPVSFHQLPDWSQDQPDDALRAFVASCRKGVRPLTAQVALRPLVSRSAWQSRCAQATQLSTHHNARHFFETAFQPYRLSSNRRETGLLTGYYVPLLQGSLTKDARFRWPVYATPPELKAKVPYHDRAAIDSGVLAGRGLELLWVDDPVMRFFMHVQGSGRVQLRDGQVVSVLFDSKNGQPYHAIGKTLLARGELAQGNVSLESIRQWLYDHPDQAMEVMQDNASYVFFRLSTTDAMPVGAQGVALTPGRSLAVDAAMIPYGLPVWVRGSLSGQTQATPLRRLLVAQDTGSAIRGPLRGDIFFGQGEQAERLAGYQKAQAQWYVLIPKAEGG